MPPIHRIHEKTLYDSFDKNGLHILDFLVYFSHPIVRKNYGIQNVSREDGFIIFEIKDEKKFFLKCIKYGI